MPFQPEFINKWGTLKLAFKSYPSFKQFDLRGILSVHNIRKRLLLNNIVKFNNQYYFTLVIPAFPSPAFDYNHEKMGSSVKRNIGEAFLAISPICPNKCIHCYEKYNLNNNENNNIPIEKWNEIIQILQQSGTSIIILTGGEPLARFDDLLKILKAGDKNRSDFHLHTAGNYLTKERALLLKEAGLKAAAVGFDDHIPSRFEKIRQKGLFDQAVDALRIFNEVGIMTYVNLCATKDFIHSGSLFEYYEFVKKLNVSFIQLLEPRPCGGYLFGNGSVILNEAERKILFDFTKEINFNKKYKNGPVVYYVAHIEGKDQMGCSMGGLSHFYIDSVGNVNPCVFLPVSFGNIKDEDFTNIFSRMREAIPLPLHKDCASLILADTIKKHSSKGVPVSFNDIKTEWKELL